MMATGFPFHVIVRGSSRRSTESTSSLSFVLTSERGNTFSYVQGKVPATSTLVAKPQRGHEDARVQINEPKDSPRE